VSKKGKSLFGLRGLSKTFALALRLVLETSSRFVRKVRSDGKVMGYAFFSS